MTCGRVRQDTCVCAETRQTRSKIPRVSNFWGSAKRGRDCGDHRNAEIATELAGQLAEEFAFVHAVLEGFAAVDEDYGDFVRELAAELLVGVDVDFLPAEQAATF
jgi:hypothetical protein